MALFGTANRTIGAQPAYTSFAGATVGGYAPQVVQAAYPTARPAVTTMQPTYATQVAQPTYATARPAAFATSGISSLAPRAATVLGVQAAQPVMVTQEVDKVDAYGRVVERDFISQPVMSAGISLAPRAATVLSVQAQPVMMQAAQPVMMTQVTQEVDVVDAYGRVVERDFVSQPVMVAAQPVMMEAAPVELAPVEPQGNFKVCVVGGAGGIGQPLCLLMAQCPLVAELAIIDLNVAAVPAEGVQADLSHIEGKCKVTSTVLVLNEDKAIDKAADALIGCDLVLVPAGVPRKPGQDRKDLLNINCDIAKGTVEACAKYCPNAVVALIVNPVNSVVPAMCELWKKAGLDSRKIVGISTLDVVRANKFVQELTGMPCAIPVIGGHAGKTILPLFSQDPAGASIPAEMIPELDERVQNAGTEVVKAKNGKGSATLSMAYSGARLAKAVLSGLAGVPTFECAYVESNVIEGLPYFASQVEFGVNGIEAVSPIGFLSPHEEMRLNELAPILQGEIEDGLEYASTREFSDGGQ